MLLKNKTIAIVGGGPGGLTLAKLLQLKGANVKVYERDFNSDVRVQGATLDLHEESGLKALHQAGLIDEFYANYRPDAGKLRILDKEATIKYDTHNITSFEENRPEIDRGPLRKLLLNSLAPETVVWDSQFVNMNPHNEGWKLTFKNGTSAFADLVIAADGARSKIRPYLSSTQLIYSGVTAMEGNIYHGEKHAPQLNELLKGGKIFAFGDEQSLILSAKGDGTLSFYTGCKVEENWATTSGIDFNNKTQVFEWFKTAFGSWNSIYQELFEFDELVCIPRPQYYYPLDQQWETLPNLIMIGDSAHLMPPYAGEGVNMAMLDALELSEHLTNEDFPDLKTAIANFEKQMLARASAVTQMTLDSTAMLHSKDAINGMLNMFETH